MSQKNNMDSSLVGYSIVTFFIIFGILMQIKLDNFWEVIGIILVFIGLLFLSIQLSQDNYTEFSFPILGIAFIWPAIFVIENQNFIVVLLFILLVSISTVFFIVGLLYTLKVKKGNNTDNITPNLLSIFVKILDVLGIIFSIFELLEKADLL
ncbi:hypothetical protein TP70_03700 [Staphylococcus microti]|uniref:Uncharacterized protein n=2 Tax=Staphylococcus microti TaxID=569857 RepID=A0A0D6XQY2_9STAP|nr:hypothetical protein [Staphylococcus microti]KIX91219.1 hypothetical protein TP70_03700 [Staphylococcus microti]SUM56470.1 Uncharacterised protein [Staphylococcus microti]